jgi:thymidylate kinase
MRLRQISPIGKKMICLIGIDGSGKTAHSRGLIDYLHKSGIKCKYVWFGVAYYFAFPFMIVCRVLGLTTIHHLKNGLAVSEHKYFENEAISEIWPWVQFLDAAIFVNLIVRPLLWRGLTVVCDRFIPDIVVDLMVDSNDDELHRSLPGRLMFRLMPRSLLLVCMDVDEKTALRRKNDVIGIGNLRLKRNYYQILSDYLEVPTLNAEEPFVLVQQQLVELAHDYLIGKNSSLTKVN